MKAVRSTGDLTTYVRVEDVDEPPGTGELIDVRSASICSSDLMYIGYGLERSLARSTSRASRAPSWSRSRRHFAWDSSTLDRGASSRRGPSSR